MGGCLFPTLKTRQHAAWALTHYCSEPVQVRQKYYRAVQVRSEAPEEEPGHRPAKAASQKVRL